MSTNNYKCGHCGYEGPCYGTPIFGGSTGVSAPWCKQCGMNNKLTEIKIDAQQRCDTK